MDFSSFWDIIAIPFGYVMQFFNWLCGGHYLLSLLLFAIAVKLVTLPLSINQQKSQIKMAQLRPKMMLIEKKYAGSNSQAAQRKKQEEIMELQQKEGYNPLSGCLPLLIQFPVIIALYRIIRMPLKYLCKLSDATIVDLYNKLHPDALVQKFDKIPDQFSFIAELRQDPSLLEGTGIGVEQLPNFTTWGIDFGQTPKLKFWEMGVNGWMILIPVLCGVLAYLSTFIMRKLNGNDPATAQQTPEQKSSMTIMNLMMPLMSVWICFITSGAIGVYWIYTSVLGIVQNVIMAKVMPIPRYTPEQIAEIQKAMRKKGKGAAGNPAREAISSRVDQDGRPRSLHNEGDD